MQNKRIHKTITKNKKRLLYLIKSCEDLSQLEQEETKYVTSTLKKDCNVLKVAARKLKEKCEGSNPVTFFVPPDKRQLDEYMKKNN